MRPQVTQPHHNQLLTTSRTVRPFRVLISNAGESHPSGQTHKQEMFSAQTFLPCEIKVPGMALVANSKMGCPRKNYTVGKPGAAAANKGKATAEAAKVGEGVSGAVEERPLRRYSSTQVPGCIRTVPLCFPNARVNPAFSIQSLKAIKPIHPCRQISPWWQHLGGPQFPLLTLPTANGPYHPTMMPSLRVQIW